MEYDSGEDAVSTKSGGKKAGSGSAFRSMLQRKSSAKSVHSQDSRSVFSSKNRSKSRHRDEDPESGGGGRTTTSSSRRRRGGSVEPRVDRGDRERAAARDSRSRAKSVGRTDLSRSASRKSLGDASTSSRGSAAAARAAREARATSSNVAAPHSLSLAARSRSDATGASGGVDAAARRRRSRSVGREVLPFAAAPERESSRRLGGNRSSLSPSRFRGGEAPDVGSPSVGKSSTPFEGRLPDESLKDYWARREQEAAARAAERERRALGNHDDLTSGGRRRGSIGTDRAKNPFTAREAKGAMRRKSGAGIEASGSGKPRDTHRRIGSVGSASGNSDMPRLLSAGEGNRSDDSEDSFEKLARGSAARHQPPPEAPALVDKFRMSTQDRLMALAAQGSALAATTQAAQADADASSRGGESTDRFDVEALASHGPVSRQSPGGQYGGEDARMGGRGGRGGRSTVSAISSLSGDSDEERTEDDSSMSQVAAGRGPGFRGVGGMTPPTRSGGGGGKERNRLKAHAARAGVPGTPGGGIHDTAGVNLHEDLSNSSWPTLHHHLTYLSNRSDLVMPALTLTDPVDNGTPLHTAVWKAPPSLALMLVRLLPTSKEAPSAFMAKDRDGNTALHLCCANLESSNAPTTFGGGSGGDANGGINTQVLEALVRSAPRALQMQNIEGDTPLHLLVTSLACTDPGNVPSDGLSSRQPSQLETAASAAERAVSILLETSLDSTIAQDSTGATPLHAAIANGAHERVLLRLLSASPVSAKVEDDRGMTPLHYVAAYLRTSLTFVKKLIEANPDAICSHTGNGDTPLHLAISNASTSIEEGAQYLGPNGRLERNVVKVLECLMGNSYRGAEDGGGGRGGKGDSQNPLLMTNRDKLTPLHCCALFDAPPQFTKLLMKHPLSHRAASMTNSFGATPLHLAAAQPGVTQSIATVVAIGTPEAAGVQDRLKRTPLHVAAQNIHATSQLIKSLAELNPDATAVKTQRGHLPLHLAAQSQAKEPVIKALIRAFPGATEARNKSSNTPLHDAAKYRASAGVVNLLLDTYPDAVYIQNQYGNLPLHCATAYQAPGDVVQLLLRAWPDGASMQNRNQDAPLHYAAAYATSADAVRPLIDAAPAAVLLLNSSGQSPIDRARANNAPAEIVRLLETSAEEWTKKAASDGWGSFSPDFESNF